MKKKILLSLLIVAILFTITGCSFGKSYKLGDAVETDIMKVKLLAGKYTYALNNVYDDDYATPKEYDPERDQRNIFVAAKGHTYAAFTFYVENLDRSDLDFGDSFDGKFVEAEYGGKKYGDEVIFAAESKDNLNWSKYSSSNILLLAGEKGYYRAYVDLAKDVKDLDSDLKLIFHLPNSNGKKEKFTFVVTADDRKSYKGEELSLEVAMKNFRKAPAKKYFENHMKEYSVLKGDEIKKALEGIRFDVSVNSWDGKFTFEKSGNIYEKNVYVDGYTNKRTWKVEGDNLILSSTNDKGKTTSTLCEVLRIADELDGYLLVADGKLYGILFNIKFK